MKLHHHLALVATQARRQQATVWVRSPERREQGKPSIAHLLPFLSAKHFGIGLACPPQVVASGQRP
jgi:hypothetical protein